MLCDWYAETVELIFDIYAKQQKYHKKYTFVNHSNWWKKLDTAMTHKTLYVLWKQNMNEVD